jgi:hypothetical protein
MGFLDWLTGKSRPVVIPPDIADRLTALGINPDRYAKMVRSEGADFTRSFVESLEDAAALCRHWSPKLRQLVAESRRSHPVPAVESLTACELAKRQVLETKIANAEGLGRRRRDEVVICCVPLFAMSAAQQLWLGEDDGCVLLTREELSDWEQVYQHDNSSFWWFIHNWWDIEDPPRQDEPWRWGKPLSFPSGESPWLVRSGLQWGMLAGGEDAELWSWNGQTARFIRTVWCSSF